MTEPHDLPPAPAPGDTAGKRKRRMTARWRYTNQRNARASTGPKTERGKAVVARNALRHGLSLPAAGDFGFAVEIVELARRIEQSEVGQNLDGEAHELACRIAETLIDLGRVRLAKRPFVIEMHADPRHCLTPLKQLARLDRYEARALSRRKRAVRAFYAAWMRLCIAKGLWPNKAMPGKVRNPNDSAAVSSPRMSGRERAVQPG
jgi:hypothetical protein